MIQCLCLCAGWIIEASRTFFLNGIFDGFDWKFEKIEMFEFMNFASMTSLWSHIRIIHSKSPPPSKSPPSKSEFEKSISKKKQIFPIGISKSPPFEIPKSPTRGGFGVNYPDIACFVCVSDMVDNALDFLDVPLLQTEKIGSIRFAIRLHFNKKTSSFDAISGRFFLAGMVVVAAGYCKWTPPTHLKPPL